MKFYYIFKGQNATCGTPHKTTGLMNMHGDLIAFSTEEKRDAFFNGYYDYNNPSTVLTKCTANTCRRFFLGMSWVQQKEYIDMHVDACVDDVYHLWLTHIN
jgi:hypothetical protein